MAWALLGQRAGSPSSSVVRGHRASKCTWATGLVTSCAPSPSSQAPSKRTHTSGQPWCTYMIRRLGYQGRGMYRMHTTCSHLTHSTPTVPRHQQPNAAILGGRTHEDPPLFGGVPYVLLSLNVKSVRAISQAGRQTDWRDAVRQVAV
ncbi:hypothetical protein CDEST_02411 [Colletotrichum destructivum]|uniref:Uncharacterized protein n=1 Tax=Colletotrichum destructivum TaxID=34406 RepID=A0AAX4I1Z7_9PEZI|nr:hypothetical protein CDEST_02411 [Colletotrichum destructivum]